MSLNEKLIELREDMGLTQEASGDKIQVARSTISGYENGTSQPSYSVLLQLADVFGVSLDYLFGRTVIKTSMKFFEGQLKTKRYLWLLYDGGQNGRLIESIGLTIHSQWIY